MGGLMGSVALWWIRAGMPMSSISGHVSSTDRLLLIKNVEYPLLPKYCHMHTSLPQSHWAKYQFARSCRDKTCQSKFSLRRLFLKEMFYAYIRVFRFGCHMRFETRAGFFHLRGIFLWRWSMGVCGGGSTQTGKMKKAFSFVFLIDYQNIVSFSYINCMCTTA